MIPFFGKTKPSEFLQAMVDGLRATMGSRNMYVDMDTFGRTLTDPDDNDREVCVGCAATWTLHHLAGKKEPDVYAFRHRLAHELYPHGYLSERRSRIIAFEQAIDKARRGTLSSATWVNYNLEDFCELPPETLEKYNELWDIDAYEDFEEELPKVESVIAALREEGL